jgi:catechol 2,3-dioxygenase-like lactoylglutathione lyase family enzyme
MEKAPQLNGLVETTLFVEDLSKASDFYETVLGLPKLKTSGIGSVFRLGPQRHLLLFNRKAAQTPNKTDSGDILPPCAVPEQNGRGPGHVAFGISNDAVDLWRVHLANHGVDLLKEINWENGARSLYFRDPDSHLIELATPGIWERA